MNKELEAIKDSWSKDTGDGRDEEGTRKLADAYVVAHPEEFTELRELSIDECVTAVSTFRNAHLEESQWRVETWLLHHFQPQQIGGEYTAQVRNPNL